jgi:class 3 adenylate cyclase
MRLSPLAFREADRERRFQRAFDVDLRALGRLTSLVLVVLAAFGVFAHGADATAFGMDSATLSAAVTLPLAVLSGLLALAPLPPLARQAAAAIVFTLLFASACVAFSYLLARPHGAGLFAAPLAVIMAGLMAAGGFTAAVAGMAGLVFAVAPVWLIVTAAQGDLVDRQFALAAFALAWLLGTGMALLAERLKRAQFISDSVAAHEKERSDNLISAMLPEFAAVRLKAGEQRIAQSFQNIGVLFADLAGFTQMSGKIGAVKTVAVLNDIFTAFDDAAARHGLERVKTMGDGYMAVANKNRTAPNDLRPLADFALEIQAIAREAAVRNDLSIAVRVGIHCGPAIGGVIGRHRPLFDYWGETINIASRLEGQGVAGDITVSPPVHARLRAEFALVSAGTATLKGVGQIEIFKLKGRLDPNNQTQPALTKGTS